MKEPRPLGPSVSPGRLKLAFIAVGVVLLGTLGALATLAKSRLEEARREREEMVASRVFDEMEREVSAFLERENERPSYDQLEQTNPETWAPFLVGYFSEDELGDLSGARIVVAEGPTSEHRRRMNWALSQARDEWAASTSPVPPTQPERARSPGDVTPPSPPLLRARQQKSEEKSAAPPGATRGAPAPDTKKPTSDREIIESLNRAPERRKAAPKSSSPSESDDPFSDYMESF